MLACSGDILPLNSKVAGTAPSIPPLAIPLSIYLSSSSRASISPLPQEDTEALAIIYDTYDDTGMCSEGTSHSLPASLFLSISLPLSSFFDHAIWSKPLLEQRIEKNRKEMKASIFIPIWIISAAKQAAAQSMCLTYPCLY